MKRVLWKDVIRDPEEIYCLDIALLEDPKPLRNWEYIYKEDIWTWGLVPLKMPKDGAERYLNPCLLPCLSYWGEWERREHHSQAWEGASRELMATQA